MRKLNLKYYICEDGCVTVGAGIKKKCDKTTRTYTHEKNKQGKWKVISTESKCNKDIKEVLDMPDELKLDEVWDKDKMTAFLEGHKASADFVITIQKEFVRLREKIDGRK